MKKKIGLGILILIEIICAVCVYLVGGEIGPWIWSACVFVIAPISCGALLIQIITIIIRVFRKKNIKWNVLFIVITIIMAYPITILFGVSPLNYPRNEAKTNSIDVINPVEDSVLLGGKEYKSHAKWPSECYAYDIVKKPYNTKSKKLNDYGVYLKDVYCPVSGTVIDMKSNEEDIEPNTEDFKSLLGNYIFIKVKETGTYIILGHLEKDSIKVSIGDNVTQGDVIAKVGNSGTTSEPHLHIQHQKNNPMNMKFIVCSEGLPMNFINKK